MAGDATTGASSEADKLLDLTTLAAGRVEYGDVDPGSSPWTAPLTAPGGLVGPELPAYATPCGSAETLVVDEIVVRSLGADLASLGRTFGGLDTDSGLTAAQGALQSSATSRACDNAH